MIKLGIIRPLEASTHQLGSSHTAWGTLSSVPPLEARRGLRNWWWLYLHRNISDDIRKVHSYSLSLGPYQLYIAWGAPR